MGIPFKELAGSPEKSWSKEGFKATRKLLVLADQEMDFVRAILSGTSGGVGIPPPCVYPSSPGIYALTVKSKPFNGVPDPGVFTDLGLDINTYTGKLLEIDIEYGLLEGDEDKPEDSEDPASQGVILSYQLDYDSEYISLPGRSCKWQSFPEVEVAKDVHPTIRASILTHTLTFHRVLNPPWVRIRDCTGCVNGDMHSLYTEEDRQRVKRLCNRFAAAMGGVPVPNAPGSFEFKFLGAEQETVLFVGAKAEKEFYGIGDFNTKLYGWKLTYIFKERRLRGPIPTQTTRTGGAANNVITWNDFFVPEQGGFDLLVAEAAIAGRGAEGIYKTVDLFNLFYFTAVPAQ